MRSYLKSQWVITCSDVVIILRGEREDKTNSYTQWVDYIDIASISSLMEGDVHNPENDDWPPQGSFQRKYIIK